MSAQPNPVLQGRLDELMRRSGVPGPTDTLSPALAGRVERISANIQAGIPVSEKLLNIVPAITQGFASTSAPVTIPKGFEIAASTLRFDLTGIETDPTQQLGYRIGQGIEDAVARAAPTDPRLADSILFDKAPRALGTTFGFITGGLVGRALGLSRGASIAAAGSASGAVEAMERGLAEGRTAEELFRDVKIGGLVGATEALPIERALKRVGIGGRRFFMEVGANVLEENIQEIGSQALFDYLTGREVTLSDIQETALVTTVSSMVFASGVSGGGRLVNRLQSATTSDERIAAINDAIESMVDQAQKESTVSAPATAPVVDTASTQQFIDDARLVTKPDLADIKTVELLAAELESGELRTPDVSPVLFESLRGEVAKLSDKQVSQELLADLEVAVNQFNDQRAAEINAARRDALDRIAALTKRLQAVEADSSSRKKLLNQLGKARADLGAVSNLRVKKSQSRAIRKAVTAVRKDAQQKAAADLEKAIKEVDPEKLGPGFREAARGITESVTDSGQTRLDSLTSTLEFLSRQPDNPIPSDRLSALREAVSKPIAELDPDEARGLTESLRLFARLNELRNDISDRLAQNEFNQTLATVVSESSSPVGALHKPVSTNALDQARGENLTFMRVAFSRAGNALLDTLASFLGGGDGTQSWRVFYKDIADSQSRALEGVMSTLGFMDDSIVKSGFDLGSDELSRVSTAFSTVKDHLKRLSGFGNLFNDTGTDVVEFSPETRVKQTVTEGRVKKTVTRGQTVKMSRAHRMTIAAMMRDPRIRELVFNRGVGLRITGQAPSESFTLTRDDFDALVESADPRDMALAGAFSRHINGPVKAAISKWSKNRRGFDITNEDPYWPIHRIPGGATFSDEQKTLTDLSNYQQAAMGSLGLVQEFRGGDLDIEVRDIFTEFQNVSWSSFMLSEMEPSISNAVSMLDSPEMSTLFRTRKNGRDIANRLRAFYDAAASSVVGRTGVTRGPIERFFSDTLRAITVGLLSINPRVALYQPVSLAAASTEMDASLLASSLDAAFDTGVDERIRAGSPYLAFRARGVLGLVNEGDQDGLRLAGFGSASDMAMSMIHGMDAAAIRVIWSAAEKRGGDVAATAERIVKRTQPTFDALHISGVGIEAKKNPVLKAVTMFRSQRSKNVDIMMRAVHRANSERTGRATVKAAHDVFVVGVLSSLSIASIQSVFSMATSGFQTDEDDDELFRFMQNAVSVGVGNIVFGEVFDAFIRSAVSDRPFFDPRTEPAFSPFISLISQATGGVKRIRTADTVGEFMEGLSRIAVPFMAARGVPIAGVVRDITRILKSLAEEDERRLKAVSLL